MEIDGYSERGAMNALFYGIALNRDEKAANAAMNVFLRMAGETETFTLSLHISEELFKSRNTLTMCIGMK